MIFASMSSDAVGFLREARWLRLRLARTSRSFFKSLPRANKKSAKGGQGSRKDLAEQEVCGKRVNKHFLAKSPVGFLLLVNLKMHHFPGHF